MVEAVIQDNGYGHIWFNTAVISRKKDAVKNRDIIAVWMSPARIGDALKLVRECVRKE